MTLHSSTETTAAEQISAFLARAETAMPDAAVTAAQVILLNGLRASLAARDEPLVKRLIAAHSVVKDGGAPVLWSGVSLDPAHAATCNQFLWTMLLLDDLEMATGLHPGGPAAIAALARLSRASITGRRLLAAIVAGIEVQVATALAAAPEMLQERGFAPLSVFAPLGAAAAGIVVDQTPPGQAAHAVGIAAMSGGGMWEMGGTSSATFVTARGVALGLSALEAAYCGVEAPERALDGPFGAYRAYSGKPIETLMDQLATLGEVWRTPQVLIQPYSGDTYSQAPLEAVAQILSRGAIEPDAIESVTVLAHERAALGVTRKTERHPTLRDDLAFNSDPPGRVAAAILRGVYSWDGSFGDLFAAPDVMALRSKTRFVADPTVPDIAGAAVEVRLIGGEVRRARIDGFTGSASRPQTYEGAAILFRDVADSSIGTDRAQYIVDLIASLPDAPDGSTLMTELI
jgi:2-methylcitrate dehydratase PrpD